MNFHISIPQMGEKVPHFVIDFYNPDLITKWCFFLFEFRQLLDILGQIIEIGYQMFLC